MQFQMVDLVILGIIGLSSLTGLFRGVVKEVIALGIWIVALWAGYNHAHSLAPLLKSYIHSDTACAVVAFVIIVLGILLVGAILNFIIGFLLVRTGLGSMDKILGMCFGFARGVIIVSLMLAIASMTSLPYKSYTENSRLCAQLQPVVQWISGYIPPILDQLKAVDSKSNGTIGTMINTIPRS